MEHTRLIHEFKRFISGLFHFIPEHIHLIQEPIRFIQELIRFIPVRRRNIFKLTCFSIDFLIKLAYTVFVFVEREGVHMKKKNKSLNQLIMDAGVVTTLAYTKDMMRKRLEPYGYNEERLKEGVSLHKEADALHYEQSKRFSAMQLEVENFRIAREAANAYYLPLLKLARIALQEDPPARLKLHLNGKRARDYGKWLTQTTQFYNGALETPGVLEQLTTCGVTQEKLEKGLALIWEAENLRVSKELKKGESLEATGRRDEVVKKLKRFVSNIQAIDRLALKADPGVPLPQI